MFEHEITTGTTVDDFKKAFHKKTNGPALKDGDFPSQNVGQDASLYFKDLGPQISWRLVFVIEYFGPILIFPIFWYLSSFIYGVEAPKRTYTQLVAFWLVIFHYLKREFETLFIHRFSNGTMPISRIPINCGHYWILFAASVGYFLFHPNYQEWADERTVNILAGAMVFFELLNLKTHLVLRNLRSKENPKARGIPQGWGFGISSCANYMWEILAWTVFSYMVNVATCWLFLAVAILQMSEWAIKKQSNYVKEFGEKYPKQRWAILPLLV